ncbi:hypothetical protein MBANPS3_006317 [Mucor bainieri]
MPLGWSEQHYKDKLHAFFLDVDWIAPKDDESKLIMIPIIQIMVKSFQMWPEMDQHPLDRERTSVLFAIQPAIYEEDMTELTCTFFKMQSAKELIAVSKTLASSDFLLVPFIEDIKSINIANLEDAMYNAIKRLLARIRGKGSELSLDNPAWTILCNLQFNDTGWLEEWCPSMREDIFTDINFEAYQLQNLKNWTDNQFIAAIIEDADVKHHFNQISGFFKKALDEFGTLKSSPDGIQHIILYSRYYDLETNSSRERDYSHYILQALLEEDIIQPENSFFFMHEIHNAQIAMQQPYKMIQIANAALPPIIVNDKGQSEFKKLQAHKPVKKLIAPNSFYVQANVTETQISFVLNKVIEVSLSTADIGLFTIQERTIEMEDIANDASYLLWNHYQSMVYLEEQQHALFERCQDHDIMVLSSSQYEEFKKDARKLIKSWLASEDTSIQEGLDTYHLLLVDQQCSCSLKLSRRLLLEVGLKPAISNIATTITSALFSDDYFGLYPLSALILEINFKTIKNTPFLCAIDGLLKQTLKEFLQLHHNRLLLLFYDKHVASNASQYVGQGGYSQVSSTTYTFEITMVMPRTGATIWLLDGDVYKSSPVIPCGDSWPNTTQTLKFTYPALAAGEDLPLSGRYFAFYVPACRVINIGM